jgi:hypothetical protein
MKLQNEVNFILWKDNFKFSDSKVEDISTFLNDKKILSSCYTTYNTDYLYDGLVDFYSSIHNSFMNSLGLYHRSKYEWHFWMQMYNSSTDGHLDHDHFSGREFISWVHFIRTPTQKCFYFLNSDGIKIYPETQNDGDFICFPSWVYHGVDKVVDNDVNRIVSAGNVSICSLETDLHRVEANCFSNTTLWLKVKK